MKETCRAAVETSLGRSITQAEARDLEGRVRRAMASEARRDLAAWRGLTPAQRIQKGAELAGKEIVAEARKAAERTALSIQKTAEIDRYVNEQILGGHDADHLKALQRVLTAKYDDKNNRLSLEGLANGLFSDAIGRVAAAADAVTPSFMARIGQIITRDRGLQTEFINALHGVSGARKEIQDAAATFHQVIDELRVHFNAIGGNIGRLENWGQPHDWNRVKALRTGQEQFVRDFMRYVDRNAYVHDDGRLFSDQEIRSFLGEAWITIVTDGASASPKGSSVKSNRNSNHRKIHLQPAYASEALLTYGGANPLSSLFNHIRQITRDIALLETFGPNADRTFELLVSKYATDIARNDPKKLAAVDDQSEYLKNLFDYLAGNVVVPKNRTLADSLGAFRSLQSAAKLGGTVISSISDLATLHSTALHNGLSPLKVAINSARIWSPKSNKYARRLGLLTDAVIGYSERYAMDNLTGRGVAQKAASLVINASGLNFVTDARRLGFSLTMMDALGAMSRRAKSLSALSAQDRALLERKGITQSDWEIWTQAKLERHGQNGKLLTSEAILAVDGYDDRDKRLSAAKFLGLLEEERDIAVVTPGARERVQLSFGTRPGTASGELVRSIVMFKAFPWALTQRYWERAQAYGGLRYAFLASMYLSLTAFGAVALWIQDLLAGRDPRNLAFWDGSDKQQSIAARNVVAASLKGGGVGVFGDFLFYEQHGYSQNSLAEMLAGPAVQSASQVFNLTQGNLAQALAGEQTDVASEAVKFARSNAPGANLWYTKALTDRFVFNALIEELEPGYFDRLQARQARREGTQYWWQPDEAAPDRFPQ